MEHCRWCGASVSPGDTICPECGTRLRRESRACRRCKREIRTGLAVCPYCGEDLSGRRIPWKLVGGLGGVAAVVVVGLLALSMAPLPFELPFIAKAPTATPTEVILPPTPTATATPRPPTATPTRRRTATPVITETATLEPASTSVANVTSTPQGTAASGSTPTTRETPTPAPTQASGLPYAAPRLVSPADETDLPENQIRFSFGTVIELVWEPVGTLGASQYYQVSLSYTGRGGEQEMQVNWTKETTFEVPGELYENIAVGEREVYWTVTVVSGTPGAGSGRAISPTSETWMFRWD
jgi:RNA polymerase subunit RPABC4/transcription elongation factor Spt4